jgi:hypothetical protein
MCILVVKIIEQMEISRPFFVASPSDSSLINPSLSKSKTLRALIWEAA